MITFDLETAPIDGAEAFIEPASAPSNYKDQAKIDAYIAEAGRKALDKAALDVDLCRIVALGTDDGSGPAVRLAHDEDEERALLADFWTRANGHEQFIGYNILDFDLPVLLRRSLYLGVDAPSVQVGKYRHERVTDLMQMLSFDGKLTYRPLSFYLRRFGIENHDGMTGAEVGAAVERGDWVAVEAHCRADVEATTALARRVGVLASEIAF